MRFFIMMLLIVILIIVVKGCTFQTPLIDVEPSRHTIVVETAKMKLSYTGDSTYIGGEMTERMVAMLQLQPLHDFNATKENNVRFESKNGKSDIIITHPNEKETGK